MDKEKLEKVNALNKKIDAFKQMIKQLTFEQGEGNYLPAGIAIDISSKGFHDKISLPFSSEYFGEISKSVFPRLREVLLIELKNELFYAEKEFKEL